MIVYDLACGGGHRFEAWFASAEAFERQQQEAAIACPVCGSDRVSRLPTAPHVVRNAGGTASGGAGLPQAAAVALQELRRLIESTCSYVGADFPEEARRIHYGESDLRGIYGEASPQAAAELRDEGIEVQTIPWLPRRDG